MMRCLTICVLLLAARIAEGHSIVRPRIIGGAEIEITEAPYQVAVYCEELQGCGCAILNSAFILTAFSCIQ